MRRTELTPYPTLLCTAIVLAGGGGVAFGALLPDPGTIRIETQSIFLTTAAEAQVAGAQTYRFVKDQPPFVAQAQTDVAAPKFSRIIIEKSGVSRLEGFGTPGSQVLIKSDGVIIGAAIAGRDGRWAIALQKALAIGDHAITTVAAGRETTQVGDEARIYIPYDFAGREIVAYERGRQAYEEPTGSLAPDASTLQRAQDLATAASEQFSQIVPSPNDPAASDRRVLSDDRRDVPSVQPRREEDLETPVASWFWRASKAYQEEVAAKLAVPAGAGQSADKAAVVAQNTAPVREPLTSGPGAAPASSEPDPLSVGATAVRNWIKDASEVYDREIGAKLSIPTPSSQRAEVPAPAPGNDRETTVVKEPRAAADISGSAAEAAHKVQLEIMRKQKALRDAVARAEAEAKGSLEARRLAEEAKRRQNEEAEAKKRDAERASAEQARKEAEAKKILNGMKRLEAVQQAEEARRAKDALQADAGKPSLPADELPSQREAARERSITQEPETDIASEPEQPTKRLEFTIEGAEDDGDLRDDRSRQARLDKRGTAKVGKPAASKRSAARVGGWRSRNDSDARQARSCSAGSIRRKGRNKNVYVVQRGDTLWAIANRHYRKGSRYNIIYRANQQRLPNANLIRPCQKLVLPSRGK
ncbi:MAG: LysM peptidoglycan-binding domain-containing protein [Hyphomicrobium sp.]